ncbi:coagulation factor 5/8 type domain-containing protein [Kribbella sp. NPDC058245]|uniref:coagulation factor 5/8 type domain-containing protein n=1 Tax=Kribbella sp. NPDC058245 TaxID=3346399 RepID=UPI0036EB5B84
MSVDSYPLPTIYPISADFAVTVDGQNVPVTAFGPEPGGGVEYHYAHFSFDGSVTVEVSTRSRIEVATVSPLAFAIPVEVSANRMTFTLEHSRYLIVKIDDLAELVIAADPAEVDPPAADGPGIFNVVTAFAADPTGVALATEAVQAAIDSAYKVGGGVAYVPAGVFSIGSVVLRSRVHLYLAGGSVLRATANPADYAKKFRHDSLEMDGTWLLSTEPGSVDVSVSGRGTIDGQGARMRKESRYLNHLFVPVGTRGLVVDGVIGRDSGSWAFLPSRCSDVTITNYKGFQTQRQYENDVLDVNECQDVVVRHMIAICEDDPYSTKAWAEDANIALSWPHPRQPVERVLFEDVVAWTHCAAFKVGNGHYSRQHDITYRQGYVYNATRAIAIDPCYGSAPCTDLVYEDIDIESLDHDRGNQSWLLIHTRERGLGIGPVSGVRIERIIVRDAGRMPPLVAAGNADGALSNIILRDVEVEGTPLKTFADLNIPLSRHVEEPRVEYGAG